MSETKHTPGEWTVETVRTSVGHAHRIQPISACIYVDHRAIGDIDDKTMKAAANARLIAAAPDLYMALQDLLAAVDSPASDNEPWQHINARKALEKARG